MKSLSVLFVFLMISMVFIPAVSAQVELKQSQLEPIPSQKEIEKFIKENTTTLKKTTTEDITEIRTEKGVIYVMTWVDEIDSSKVNLAFIPQNELINSKYVDMKDIANDSRVSSAVSKASVSFSRGSYVQNYGNLQTGGIIMHLGPDDAALAKTSSQFLIAALGPAIGYVLGGVVGAAGGPLAVVTSGSGSIVGGIVAAVVCVIIEATYSYTKNPDGSITGSMSYASIALLYLRLPGGTLTLGRYTFPVFRL